MLLSIRATEGVGRAEGNVSARACRERVRHGRRARRITREADRDLERDLATKDQDEWRAILDADGRIRTCRRIWTEIAGMPRSGRERWRRSPTAAADRQPDLRQGRRRRQPRQLRIGEDSEEVLRAARFTRPGAGGGGGGGGGVSSRRFRDPRAALQGRHRLTPFRPNRNGTTAQVAIRMVESCSLCFGHPVHRNRTSRRGRRLRAR